MPEAATNPFQGLRRFDIADSEWFFGRNEQTYELLRRLRLINFVAVLGPSGCGKSSLIRAGVLAALRDGYMADDAPWEIAELQPANNPIEEWLEALRPYLREGAPESQLLQDPASALNTENRKIAILVDQFEELFQYADRTGLDRHVQTFLHAMLSISSSTDSPVYVVLTMRSDFLARCAQYPALAAAVNEGLYLVPEMTRDQMKEAIVQPVRKVGAEITAPLVDRLLNDAVVQKDALPVLQHALMRMWQRKRPFEPLGLPEYEAQVKEAGAQGIGSFLHSHAEEIYVKLPLAEQNIAQQLFRRITELTEDGQATRRATERAQIAATTGIAESALTPVIEKFRQSGFLNVWESRKTTSPLVDLAHEAVARQWLTLRDWMIEEFRVRRNIRRVREVALEWSDRGKNDTYLFRGLRLSEANHYLKGREGELDQTVRDFLTASRREDVWTWVQSPNVLMFLLTGMVVTGTLAWQSFRQSSEATLQLRVAQEQRMRADTEAKNAIAAKQEAERNLQSAQAAQGRLAKQEHFDVNNRVYIQIRNEGQRSLTTLLIEKLKEKKFHIPGVEVVAVGPAISEIRYFRKNDFDEAKEIEDLCKGAGIPARAQYIAGYETSTAIRDGHFELWIAPPPPTAR